jgi:acyl-CoA thioester hydrolase
MKKHIYKTRVRYSETDQMSVVHNSVYYIYMELARTDLVRAEGVKYKEMEEMGIFMPVLESGCKYKVPAKYDDDIEVVTHIAYYKNASLRFEYRIQRSDGVLLATGYSVHAAVDKDFQVTVLPEEWRVFFTQYLPD